MKYKVIRPCLYCFGSFNKAYITLNFGQVWEGRQFSIDSDYYKVSRNNITMQIHKEGLNKYFKLVESEVKDDTGKSERN